MINEVVKLLNTTYGQKRVQALNKVCDYYNDGLYKKVKSKRMDIGYYEVLNLKNKENKKLELLNGKTQKVFPRDLIIKRFKLLDLEKQEIIDIKVINDKTENYKEGILSTSSPLVCSLINKKVNDIVIVKSLDNRKNLITEYRILQIN